MASKSRSRDPTLDIEPFQTLLLPLQISNARLPEKLIRRRRTQRGKEKLVFRIERLGFE
jgi:hypothetical protein